MAGAVSKPWVVGDGEVEVVTRVLFQLSQVRSVLSFVFFFLVQQNNKKR
jgi:hypothetical protein